MVEAPLVADLVLSVNPANSQAPEIDCTGVSSFVEIKSDGKQEPRADGYTPLKRLTKIRAGRHVGMFTGVRWCSLTFAGVRWCSLTFTGVRRTATKQPSRQLPADHFAKADRE